MKFDKRKDIQLWKNGVGQKIEKKLNKTLRQVGIMMGVTLFKTTLGQYSVQLTNNRRLVMNLTRRTCSCRWWQLHRLPYAHAMAIIENDKLLVYDYV